MTSCVRVSLRVAATPIEAFEVFTQEIGAWWRPNGLFQITPRGDGALAFENAERLITALPNGKIYEIGRVTTWTPGEALAFTWRPASVPPEQTTRVEVVFEAIGAETRVTVSHFGWSEIPAENAARHGFPEGPFLMRTAEWWRAELASLAAHMRP